MLVCIFGKRGAGKTHTIKRAIKDCIAPVVVIDILGNFTDEDFPDAFISDGLAETMQTIKDYKTYEAATDTERGLMEEIPPVIIHQPADPNLSIDYISALLWELGDATLVLDEVDAFNFAKAPAYDYLIRYGRNRGIHLLTGCRRPAEISRNITAGANALYIYQTQEPRDVEYYEKTLLTRDQAKSLKNLPDYHGIFINYDKKTVGTFKSDEKGDIFILTENSVRNNSGETEGAKNATS